MGFHWRLWDFDGYDRVYIRDYGFLLTIMGFHGDYGFLLAIMFSYWRLCFHIGDYGYLIDKFLTSCLRVIELIRNHSKLLGKCLKLVGMG